MHSAIARSFEALALIGVTSALLLVGCDAAAAPLENRPPDHVPSHANAHSAQHDALNAVLPAFDRHAYDRGSDAGADPVVAPAAVPRGMLAVLFLAQM